MQSPISTNTGTSNNATENSNKTSTPANPPRFSYFRRALAGKYCPSHIRTTNIADKIPPVDYNTIDRLNRTIQSQQEDLQINEALLEQKESDLYTTITEKYYLLAQVEKQNIILKKQEMVIKKQDTSMEEKAKDISNKRNK